MKQEYEHSFLYFLLSYIVNMTYNDKYIFLSVIFEIKIYCVSNPTFLIHQFQFWKNVPLKTVLINELYFMSGHTAIG